MFEPLLQIPLADAWVQDIQIPPPGETRRLRVVLVAEIYETPGRELRRLADRNTVAIVEALLRSEQVGFIAVGDHDREIYFDPWQSDSSAAAAQASADLAAGRIHSFDFIARALLNPTVPLFGVADRHTRGAEAARERRLAGLREIHRSAAEPAPGLLRGILVRLQQAGFQEPLVESPLLADWPALRQLFLDLLALPAAAVDKAVHQLMEESPAAGFDPERGTVSLLAEVLGERLPALSPPALRRLRDGLLDHVRLLLLQESLQGAAIPLLVRCRQRLEVLKQSCPDLMRRAEERFGVLRQLPALFAIARELQIDPTRYVQLNLLQSLLRHEQLDPHRLRRERAGLAQSLLSTLVAGESRGPATLLGLLKKAVRENDPAVLASSRPLHACTQRELARLYELEARDIETGQRYKPRVQQHLLNLAALLKMDDGTYRAWRQHLLTYEAGGRARHLLYEFEALERRIRRAFATLAPAAGAIYESRRLLQILEDLSREELSLEKATRILVRPPSARQLVRFLASQGDRPEALDWQEAEQFDEQCLAPACDFYEHCSELVEVFRRKILARMSERRADAAILLCGGFYAQAVAQTLAREEVLCSIVTPRFTSGAEPEVTTGRKSPDDPRALRDRAQSLLRSVTFHFLGIKPEWGSAHPGGLGFDLTRQADSHRWTALQARRVAWEEWLAGVRGQALHECRNCKRQAPLEERPLICRRGYVPDRVLPCRECPPETGRFLCAHCAGRDPIPFLPGHALSEAPEAETVEVLVCNIHGIPLGGEQPPRWLSGGLPGHSLLG